MNKDFHHPFKPYDIQTELMTQIYDLLRSNKKVGIFESPTGTGKTLSLICSTVTWLRENKAGNIGAADAVDAESSEDEPDWVNDFYNERLVDEKVNLMRDYEAYLDSLDPKVVKPVIRELEDRSAYKGSKRKRIEGHLDVAIEEDAFLPSSFDEESQGSSRLSDKKKQLDSEIQALLSKIDKGCAPKAERNLDIKTQTKIFFASRTHSQLAQFASQLALPEFPTSSPKLDHERIKFLPLASRKQLCIHSKVSKLKSDLINDSCAETTRKNECQFYLNSKDQITSKQFRDYSFAEIQDIEDLVQLGKGLHICPYYSSRTALDGAEVVTLPYQHLLSIEARQSLGIDLKESIVIIDEAHNLIDTITSIYGADLSLPELIQCKTSLKIYFNKFKKRLSSSNRVNLLKLLKLIDTLESFLKTRFVKGKELNPQDIFQDTNADLLNIHKLVNYMKVSKIAYKIDSYFDWKTNLEAGNSERKTAKQPLLFKVSKFLSSLSNPSTEGRFFFEGTDMIRYMLLEPSEIFKSIVDECKCVILAGGTMQPTSEFTDNLIPFISSKDIVQYSCSHIIPDSNLDTFIVSGGFEFTFEKRKNESMIIQLFDFILELSFNVPHGIIVFFPSYKYLEHAIEIWKVKSLYDKLNSNKKVFYETSGGKDILPDYTSTIISDNKGAILFSVVGGKLSEGINFQDNLARAVVMVGLPFPNTLSSELIIKTNHLKHKIISGGGNSKDALLATKDFYENICMKSVNQSVGRAIRHANDYANIYLVDKRYLNLNIKNKLSEWVKKRIQPDESIKDIIRKTQVFFKEKNNMI